MCDEFGSVKNIFRSVIFWENIFSTKKIEKSSRKNIFSKRDFIQIDVHAFWMELGRWEFEIGATGRGSGDEGD